MGRTIGRNLIKTVDPLCLLLQEMASSWVHERIFFFYCEVPHASYPSTVMGMKTGDFPAHISPSLTLSSMRVTVSTEQWGWQNRTEEVLLWLSHAQESIHIIQIWTCNIHTTKINHTNTHQKPAIQTCTHFLSKNFKMIVGLMKFKFTQNIVLTYTWAYKNFSSVYYCTSLNWLPVQNRDKMFQD